jgi:predicted pyridoxine 5'-phosphate oxidase superfamily flavin-nucleotide-binding protein
MRVTDESTLGLADFSGNKQYVSTGNFRSNDCVALFFMDYPNKQRLIIMGRIKLVPNNDWETLAKLEVEGYRANVESSFFIHVEVFDWNGPQHMTPRFTEEDSDQLLAPLVAENEKLKQQASTEVKENPVIDEGELNQVILAYVN